MLRLVASRLGASGAGLARTLKPELLCALDTQVAARGAAVHGNLPGLAEPGLQQLWQRSLATSVRILRPCVPLRAGHASDRAEVSVCTQATHLQETATKPDSHIDQHTTDARKGAGVETHAETHTQDPRETQKQK